MSRRATIALLSFVVVATLDPTIAAASRYT